MSESRLKRGPFDLRLIRMWFDYPKHEYEHVIRLCDAHEELLAEAARLKSEAAMLRKECQRLMCGDYFVTSDGRTVSCGLVDGHGGDCAEKACSEPV